MPSYFNHLCVSCKHRLGNHRGCTLHCPVDANETEKYLATTFRGSWSTEELRDSAKEFRQLPDAKPLYDDLFDIVDHEHRRRSHTPDYATLQDLQLVDGDRCATDLGFTVMELGAINNDV